MTIERVNRLTAVKRSTRKDVFDFTYGRESCSVQPCKSMRHIKMSCVQVEMMRTMQSNQREGVKS